MFGTTNLDLRKALAEMIKKLCIDDLSRDTENATSIEAFTACAMIPLVSVKLYHLPDASLKPCYTKGTDPLVVTHFQS